MKLILVGPLPPPIGGISVHLERLSGVLRANQTEFVIFNESNFADPGRHIWPIGSYKKMIMKLPFVRGDLFHFHSIDPRMRMLLGFYKTLGKKVMLTIHGDSLAMQLAEAGPLEKKLLLASLRRLDRIVCVNEATTRMLLGLGFDPRRVRTVPAYIHPVERADGEAAIPAEVRRWMDEADFLISANGFVRPLPEGDLYGIDLLVSLAKELKDNRIRARLLFVLLGAADQNAEERAYYGRMKQRIAKQGLSDMFYWYEAAATELYPILKKSRLFIRPTRMDGYGVSVAEALHFGVPAIASDACARPQGTLLFPSGDLQALARQVREVAQHYEKFKQAAQNAAIPDYAADLIGIYNEITGERLPVESIGMPRANR